MATKRYFQFAMVGGKWSDPSPLNAHYAGQLDRYLVRCLEMGWQPHFREVAAK